MNRAPKSAGALLAGVLMVLAAAAHAAPAAQTAHPAAPRTADDRRQALALLQAAQTADDAGRTVRARGLALKAQKLYPESKSIAALVASLKAAAPARPRALTPEMRNRLTARAHLAAGLSRAQVLMDHRQYRDSVDLLGGVLAAVELFPASTEVMTFADQAHQLLRQYHEAARRGELGPERLVLPAGPASRSDRGTRPNRSSGIRPSARAAENAARLSPSLAAAPPWYTHWKSCLATPVAVDYPGMTLEYVVKDLEEKTGAVFVLDPPVRRAGIDQQPAIDLRVRGASAESVLSLATQVVGTEYVLMEKAVVITSPERARVYQRRLPEVLAHNWAAAKFLFPDAELRWISRAPRRPLETAEEGGSPPGMKAAVQPYLRSGEALVADVRHLLRS